MVDQNFEMKIIRLGSLLNIMEREIDGFLETGPRYTMQRLDDFRALAMGMKDIIHTITPTDYTGLNLTWLESHQNIMEREIINFSETWESDSEAKRLNDLQALVFSMQGMKQKP